MVIKEIEVMVIKEIEVKDILTKTNLPVSYYAVNPYEALYQPPGALGRVRGRQDLVEDP